MTGGDAPCGISHFGPELEFAAWRGNISKAKPNFPPRNAATVMPLMCRGVREFSRLFSVKAGR